MASRTAKRDQSEEVQPALPTWRQPPPVRRAQSRRNYDISVPAERPGWKITPPTIPWRQLWSALSTRQWAVVVAGIIVAAGLMVLLRADLFAVGANTVRIVGNQRVSSDVIYQASALDQRNLFRIDPAISANQVAALMAISSANVNLRLPNEAIISVDEYQPLLAWQVITQTLWIAADGSSIPAVGEAPGLRLVDEGGAAMDEHGAIRPKVVDALVALHSAYPQVAEVWYGALEGLYFRSDHGWTVYLGNGDGMVAKLDLLQSTEREIAARGTPVSRIDMRFPGQAILK